MKALIIDDERLARKELINLLKDHPEIEIIGECENVEDAKEKIASLHPDLLFLDVEMPEKSGFDLLNEIEESPQVIFVTAYQDHALTAFDVNAFDYLTKPVLSDRLSETIKNLFQEKKELNNLISNKKQFLQVFQQSLLSAVLQGDASFLTADCCLAARYGLH